MTVTREQILKGLVAKFLAWPLPESVCSDTCASIRGYPHRTGTVLLDAVEAEQMLASVCEELLAERDELRHVQNALLKHVDPGTCDSVDALHKIVRERDTLREKLRVAVEALEAIANSIRWGENTAIKRTITAMQDDARTALQRIEELK